VPSILNYMAKFDAVAQGDFPELERLLWCGEVFPTPPLRYWMERLPHVVFTNLYGPTEATIASSYYTLPGRPASETDAIPIGRPCAGEELLVLDADARPVPPGEVGDLYIGGVGLSPGYWRDPEKTATAFRAHPDHPGSRIYRTGDLASIGEDRLVFFHGRSDSQIKSRGYRIELGEIETAVHAIDGLRESAVVAIETTGFEGYTICCAFARVTGTDVTPVGIRSTLATTLPGYMLPARWRELERLPKNANGKIDRPALRQMFRDQA
jgi:acyl-coenzyme A synthetase/AMP-(fatty) acid ligase